MSPQNQRGQGFGIGTPDPNRTGPCTRAQVKRLRDELQMIEGNESILLALVYATTGREELERLEDMTGYEAQLAFQIMANKRSHRAIKIGGRPAGRGA